MKILIYGVNGMLGHKLYQILQKKNEVFGTIRSSYNQIEHFGIFEENKIIAGINVESEKVFENTLEKIKPDIVLNAVGIIKQIPTAKDVIKTLNINSIFPHRLAEWSQKMGFRLITIGTDCVFSGNKGNYVESDVADAVDLYGRSKHFGELCENNCLTLRTSIIGRELLTKNSLIEWFLSNRNSRVRGYKNAIYSGFPTIIFADLIANLIENHANLQGLYHVSAEPINKFDLLRLVNEKYNANIEIEPYDDFYIDRSLNSDRFRVETKFQPPNWETMIEKMAEDRTPYDKYRK